MSIRPIDMQGMVPKSQQISKIQNNNDYRQEYYASSQTLEQNKKIERRQKQVNKTSESYKLKINRESESSKKKYKNNKREQNNKKKNNSKVEEKRKSKGKYLDIKI